MMSVELRSLVEPFTHACRTGEQLGRYLANARSITECALRSGVKAAIGAGRMDVIASIASAQPVKRSKRLREVLIETVLQCRSFSAFVTLVHILPFKNEMWIYTVEEGDARDLEFLFQTKSREQFDATCLFNKVFLQRDYDKLDVTLRHCTDEDLVETLGRTTTCKYDKTGDMLSRVMGAVRDKALLRRDADPICVAAMYHPDESRLREILTTIPDVSVPYAARHAVEHGKRSYLQTILDLSPATDFTLALRLAAWWLRMDVVRAILRTHPETAVRVDVAIFPDGEARDAILKTRTWLRRRVAVLWGMARVKSGMRVKRVRCE